ncbi:hypothetical protein [Methylobacterium sp. WL19]|uniref:hypothetical protein n=1 Tax=Methylobacterium sp. WL19 TaxID=2603896 RepID=UPI0011CBEEBF|nr:hypothetical protein [Methylobacterium sp. WL19]TXN25567.1 hypothetical protein FV220_18305 [Methylobacterium sp. WL19]
MSLCLSLPNAMRRVPDPIDQVRPILRRRVMIEGKVGGLPVSRTDDTQDAGQWRRGSLLCVECLPLGFEILGEITHDLFDLIHRMIPYNQPKRIFRASKKAELRALPDFP